MEKSLIGKNPGSASALFYSQPIKYFISLEVHFPAHASLNVPGQYLLFIFTKVLNISDN